MNTVICPRCEGDGEEVGAPVDTDGVWVCELCHGEGSVPRDVAEKYLATTD